MNVIKEFLKPNRWKILIFGTFLLLGSLVILCYFLFWKFFLSVDAPSYVVSYISYCRSLLEESPGSQPSLVAYLILGPALLVGELIYFLFWGIIYWYLLACLIYFVFSKVKHLISKPR